MDEKSLKPQLRFKGFADAWEQRKLSEIASYLPSNLSASNTDINGRFDLYDANGVIGKTNAMPQKESYITIIKDGSGVGRVRMLPPQTCYIGTMGGIFSKATNNIDFIFHTLSNFDFSTHIIGATIPHVYFSDYGNDEIGVPYETEQKMIGKFFSNLDNLITLHQRKLDKLSNVKKALLEKIFPKNDSDVPEIRFKGFTDAWEQRKFKSTIQIERGSSPRPIEDYITNSENGLNWIKIGDAPSMGKYITKTAEKIKPEGLSKTREVHPGDLILSNSMSFGRPYIMAINGCIHDGWLLLRNDKNLYDLQFLCHLLGSENMLHQYKSFAAGSTVNNLNKDLVGNTTVSFPKKTEQSKLGAFFDSLDNLITLHQRKLEKLKNIKKACLEKMFV